MTNLKTKILDTVKNNNLRMIPRWKFVLYSLLTIVGILFVFLLAVFAFSLVLFVLSRYGVLSLPFFEIISNFRRLSAIPIALFLVTVILLVIIEIISRKYTFAFRTPLATTLLTVTILTVASSFVISQTGMHEKVRDFARDHHFGFAHAYDRPFPFDKDDHVMRGVIVATGTNMLSVRLFDGQVINAYGTGTPLGLSLGDDVVLFGEIDDGQFQIEMVKQVQGMGFGGPRNRGAGMMK